MDIREIMTKDPACITPGATAREAARLMEREDAGAIPVVESDDSRRLVGMVTDRDIAIRVVADGRDADTRVSDIMSSRRLTTARTNDDVQQVLATMGREQIRRVPVVDDRGTLVGIVSQADLARKASHDHAVERTVEQISQPGGKHSQ